MNRLQTLLSNSTCAATSRPRRSSTSGCSPSSTAGPGRGGVENKRSTDVEPPLAPPRISTSIHPEGNSWRHVHTRFGGGVENKHSTDVEPRLPPPRISTSSTSIHPKGKSVMAARPNSVRVGLFSMTLLPGTSAPSVSSPASPGTRQALTFAHFSSQPEPFRLLKLPYLSRKKRLR